VGQSQRLEVSRVLGHKTEGSSGVVTETGGVQNAGAQDRGQ